MNALQTLGYFRKCEGCKKTRFRVKKRAITLPTGQIAISQKLICKKCQINISKALQC